MREGLKINKLKDKQTSPSFAAGGRTWCLTCFPKQDAPPHTHVSLFLECQGAPGITDTAAGVRVAFSLTAYNLSDTTINITKTPPAAPPRESVGGDLLALLERPGATSDVTLVAGGRSFPAHRAILASTGYLPLAGHPQLWHAARSEFFARLFDSGMSDSSSREVPLPDADPDALVLLLRYMYGGVLEACAPAVLRPAAELADRLLLPAARASLQQRLVAATCPDRLLDDMAWAEARGYGTMLAALETLYRRDAAKVPSEQVEALAERSPKLMARLHLLLLGRG
ncbi:hypothetical protein HYH03_016266 [Edaphochlamys debaryana]|uniref:BTB domain-containing protein n=1 Tax=Edaphochlamys debaryana TaxID=47281 RepID=A0A835XS07_9CHLO|nr:hypothetical protein HYH03_016266 [Edaphochlamys debaryana]|eukprot:KAG2484969.1 hypothetical protein HYH03_016266 [Edaphochlamys debaryana]